MGFGTQAKTAVMGAVFATVSIMFAYALPSVLTSLGAIPGPDAPRIAIAPLDAGPLLLAGSSPEASTQTPEASGPTAGPAALNPSLAADEEARLVSGGGDQPTDDGSTPRLSKPTKSKTKGPEGKSDDKKSDDKTKKSKDKSSKGTDKVKDKKSKGPKDKSKSKKSKDKSKAKKSKDKSKSKGPKDKKSKKSKGLVLGVPVSA